jgi:hypothetical protein
MTRVRFPSPAPMFSITYLICPPHTCHHWHFASASSRSGTSDGLMCGAGAALVAMSTLVIEWSMLEALQRVSVGTDHDTAAFAVVVGLHMTEPARLFRRGRFALQLGRPNTLAPKIHAGCSTHSLWPTFSSTDEISSISSVVIFVCQPILRPNRFLSNDRMSGPFGSLLRCKIWTKESKVRLRRAFVRLIASAQKLKFSE